MHEKAPHPAVTALAAFTPLPLAALVLPLSPGARAPRRALLGAACFSLAALSLAAAAVAAALPGWREVLVSFALLALAFLFVPPIAGALAALLRAMKPGVAANALLVLTGGVAFLPAPLLALLAGLILTRAGLPLMGSCALRFVLAAFIAALLPAWTLALTLPAERGGAPLLPSLAVAFPPLGLLVILGCLGVETALSLPGLGALAWSALAGGSLSGLLLPLAFIVLACLGLGVRALRLSPDPADPPGAPVYPAGDRLAFGFLLLAVVAALAWLLLPVPADPLPVYQPPSAILPWGSDHLGRDARLSAGVLAAPLIAVIAAAAAARRLAARASLPVPAPHFAIVTLPVLLLAGLLLSALPAPVAVFLFGLSAGAAAALFPGQAVLCAALTLLAPFFFGHLFPSPAELLTGALLSPASGFTGLSARLSLPFLPAAASFSLTFVQTRNKK